MTYLDALQAALAAASGLKKNNLPELEIGMEKGDTGASVRQAQKLLRYIGQYRGRTDGVFDQDLKESVTALQIAAGLIKQSTDEAAGRIGPGTRAAILKEWKVKVIQAKTKTLARKMDLTDKVTSEEMPKKFLAKGDKGKEVKLLQSFLIDAGYLDSEGETGTFGGRTLAALTKYQLDRKIVTSSTAKGAGVFGPATRVIISKDLVAMKWQDVRAGK